MAQYNPRTPLADLAGRQAQQRNLPNPLLKGKTATQVMLEGLDKIPPIREILESKITLYERELKGLMLTGRSYGMRTRDDKIRDYAFRYGTSQPYLAIPKPRPEITGKRADMVIFDDIRTYSDPDSVAPTLDAPRMLDEMLRAVVKEGLDRAMAEFCFRTRGRDFYSWGYSSDMNVHHRFTAAIRKAARYLPDFMGKVGASHIAVTGTSGLAGAFALQMLIEIPVIVVKKASSHGSKLSQAFGDSLVRRYVFFDDFVSSGETLHRLETEIGLEAMCVGIYEYCDDAYRSPGATFPSEYGARIPFCDKE